MKRIIFVRHAKAEVQNSSISDFERSLALKGKYMASLMASMLKEKTDQEATVISSPAFRAIETAMIFCKVLGYDTGKIIMNENLYPGTGLKGLKAILQEAGDDADTIMLFGHNPAFSDLPDTLCKHGCDIMPKCGVISISFKIQTWSEIKQKTGKTEYYLKPEKVL
ncbi:MAG TPA: histidine phosphatase family protein [Bacteroidales bacterium]|nr:histidine phosphatase family protein [Bacteroidales bacterium]